MGNYPILEFDSDPHGVIEPVHVVEKVDAPERCVLCFFQDVLEGFRKEKDPTVIAEKKTEHAVHPLLGTEVDGTPIAVLHPGVGAPLAAAMLDGIIAIGCNKIIVCGGCGVLDGNIPVGGIIVPTSAVRDEGTSYHYLPPSPEVEASPDAVSAIEKVLTEHDVSYVLGKTWTTDGWFRETRSKVKRRREQGCLTVEAEAAALFAVAQFREVKVGQILYGGDDVSGDEWNRRNWVERPEIRKNLFWLAIEACLAM